MAHYDEVTRFEEHYGQDGSVQSVFIGAVQTDDTVAGESQYWEHWFTPQQVKDYVAAVAAGTQGDYVLSVIATVAPERNTAWKTRIANRPPAPKRFTQEEVRAGLIPSKGATVTDSTGTKPVA